MRLYAVASAAMMALALMIVGANYPVLAEGGMKTSACIEQAQYDHALAFVQGKITTGDWSDLQVISTTEDADKFLVEVSKVTGNEYPPGKADHILVFRAMGSLWIFGYKGGCQVGWIRMHPEATPKLGRAA